MSGAGSAFVVITLWFLNRTLAARKARGAGPPHRNDKKDRPDPHWAGLTWLFFGPALFVDLVLVAAGEAPAWPWLPIAALELVLLFPNFVANALIAPLGLPRLAYYVGFLSDVWWDKDHTGGGAVAAARALLRSSTPAPEIGDWIEARVGRGRVLKAGGITAAGLVAAARGDLPEARRLLESAEWLDTEVAGGIAARLAVEWRVGDAARRGDWALVLEIGSELGAHSRLTRLLYLVAGRYCETPDPPTDRQLVLRWLLAPRRRHTLDLLRRALAHAPSTASATMSMAQRGPECLELPSRGDPLADALARHAATAQRARPTLEDARALGRAWDAALDDVGTEQKADQRALALGAPSGILALDELRLAVEEDLATLAREAELPLADLEQESRVLGGAARRLRDVLLVELETTCEAVGRRAAEGRELPALDEWREFVALREQHSRAARLGGLELRRLVFPKLHTDVCKWHVWMWNERREKALSNAMARFLLAEAEDVESESAVELQKKNVACGSGI